MRTAVPKPPMRTQEKASDYFEFERWPELRDRKVTRGELLFWLTHHHRVMQEQRPWNRFTRWLQRYYARSATAPLAEVKDA